MQLFPSKPQRIRRAFGELLATIWQDIDEAGARQVVNLVEQLTEEPAQPSNPAPVVDKPTAGRDLRTYLDAQIALWRQKMDSAPDDFGVDAAGHFIDALQQVRQEFFGQQLGIPGSAENEEQ